MNDLAKAMTPHIKNKFVIHDGEVKQIVEVIAGEDDTLLLLKDSTEGVCGHVMGLEGLNCFAGKNHAETALKAQQEPKKIEPPKKPAKKKEAEGVE